jgi:hypothetical protein
MTVLFAHFSGAAGSATTPRRLSAAPASRTSAAYASTPAQESSPASRPHASTATPRRSPADLWERWMDG